MPREAEEVGKVKKTCGQDGGEIGLRRGQQDERVVEHMAKLVPEMWDQRC